MDIDNIGGYTLKNLNKINVILGKNGCGKSRMFRQIEQNLVSQTENYRVRYITPERGGALVYNASVEGNISQGNNRWLFDTRRKNQFTQFKEQSVAQFRKLETLILREIAKENPRNYSHTFETYIEKINSLLENVRMETRNDITFKIFLKSNPDTEIRAEDISSGESELISIAIECLIFSKEHISDKRNILLLDEPDVHLHPDLQFKLMRFLQNLVNERDFCILIATHSTSILSALAAYESTHIGFMEFDQKEIEFKPVNPAYRKILPVFGAHPLSNVFNETPIMLVDGEDDERIWQQAVRTSGGKIKVYPCSVDGVGNMNDFETETTSILKSVYDNARAYSLRDRDNADDSDIDDVEPVIKFRLKCRSAENLLLTNEVLSSLGTDWNNLKGYIASWIQKNPDHQHHTNMLDFQRSQFDRKNHDIKEIRNVLMGIIGSSKPWEVAVGQTIAALRWNDSTQFNQDGSIYSFLGDKLVKNIIPNAE